MKTISRLTISAVAVVLFVACATPARAPTPAPAIVQTVVVPQTVIATTAPAGTLTVQPAAGTTPAGTPPTAGKATQPYGITAVNNFEPGARAGGLFDGALFDDRTYANPNVAGLTFRTSWADIEPTKDNFVWAKLDTVFDNSEKNGKWVELVLIPGFGTPAWALQGVQTATFSVIYAVISLKDLDKNGIARVNGEHEKCS